MRPGGAGRQSNLPHAGWLRRAQVAAALGYRNICPIRKMEGEALHPVRAPRGWLFDSVEVAALKPKRPIGGAAAQDDRRRRAEEEPLRELDRRAQQDQQNFEKIMSALNVTGGQVGTK
jgi:hypothetical protein